MKPLLFPWAILTIGHTLDFELSLTFACLREAALACQRTLFGEQVGEGRDFDI